MSQEQISRMAKVQQYITDVSFQWPTDPWEDRDYYAIHLLKLLSRIVEDKDIVHAGGSVTGDLGERRSYEVTLFTESLIVLGKIDAPAPEDGRLAYPKHADVAAVPYSKVTGVTLHDIANYGEQGMRTGTSPIAFSVTLDGHPTVSLERPRTSGVEAQARLFDRLMGHLANS